MQPGSLAQGSLDAGFPPPPTSRPGTMAPVPGHKEMLLPTTFLSYISIFINLFIDIFIFIDLFARRMGPPNNYKDITKLMVFE